MKQGTPSELEETGRAEFGMEDFGGGKQGLGLGMSKDLVFRMSLLDLGPIN